MELMTDLDVGGEILVKMTYLRSWCPKLEGLEIQNIGDIYSQTCHQYGQLKPWNLRIRMWDGHVLAVNGEQ